MTDSPEDFLASLIATFRIEAGEHLQAITAGILGLEHSSDAEQRRETLAAIFRNAHSLKGAARAVGESSVEAVCQQLESVFSNWKRSGESPTPESLDVIHATLDTLSRLLAVAPPQERQSVDVGDVLRQLAPLEQPPQPRAASAVSFSETDLPTKSAALAEVAALLPPVKPPAVAEAAPASLLPHVTPETLRIPVARLDALLLQVQELVALKLTANQRVQDLQSLVEAVSRWDKQSRARHLPQESVALHRAVHRLSTLSDDSIGLDESFTGADSTDDMQIRSLQDHLDGFVKSAKQDSRSIAAMVDTLLEDCKKLLMLRFGTLMESFPKLVRDLSRELEKNVELVMHGTEIEVDKRILEEMKDPLVHLLRNALDHGIESPAERIAAGKPAHATVTVSVSQLDGNKVEIRVADDGRGIDPSRVRAAGVRHETVTAEEADRLSDEEAMELIFRPEVTTSPIITEISGRGIGLAIVRERAEKLGGKATLETRVGAGTTFCLVVPVTLATFRGVLVQAGGQVFVLPVANIAHVARIRASDVETINSRDTIRLQGRALSLVGLDDVLELPAALNRKTESDFIPSVILGSGDQKVAFRVEAVLNEQEVLVKRLCHPLLRVRNVAGATVLGSGKAVPILNAADLLKSAGRAARTIAAGAAAEDATPVERSVLIVEDSITARMLLKNIFEAAGYRATTAVDGIDAWSTLRTTRVDVVVSDVEMPRMNGFDLTARIRADPKFADIPVVLVTALASREDRERGVDAGASAYIVKSSFDQSNLLEVVRGLL